MTAVVEIVNLAYSPQTVQAPMTGPEPGYPLPQAHVDWIARDSDTAHTVTFDDPELPSSGLLQPGAVHQGIINKTGTFAFRCTVHPEMKGTLVVTPVPSTVARPSTTSPASGSDGSGTALWVVVLVVVIVGALAIHLRRRPRRRREADDSSG